eukprot:159701-Chlamydomonas_euryale.AAC.1
MVGALGSYQVSEQAWSALWRPQDPVFGAVFSKCRAGQRVKHRACQAAPKAFLRIWRLAVWR